MLTFKLRVRPENMTAVGGPVSPFILQIRVMWLQTGAGHCHSKVVDLHKLPWQPSDSGYITADQAHSLPPSALTMLSERGVVLFSLWSCSQEVCCVCSPAFSLFPAVFLIQMLLFFLCHISSAKTQPSSFTSYSHFSQ